MTRGCRYFVLACVVLWAPSGVGGARMLVDVQANATSPARAKWRYADALDIGLSYSNTETVEEMIADLEGRSAADKKRRIFVKRFDGKDATCDTPGEVRDFFANAPVHYDMKQSFSYLGSLKSMLSEGYSHTLCGTAQDFCHSARDIFDSTWTLSYNDVVAELETIPERYASKQIVKGNDLGEFILNDKLWKNDPYLKAIALGADVETHSWVRPILDKIWGHGSPAWNDEKIRAMVQQFFQGRTSFDSAKDPYILLAKIMHSVTLGIELSDEKAREFQEWQAQLPVFIVLPGGLVSGIGGAIFGGTTRPGHEIRAKRDELLAEYKKKIMADYMSNNQERPFKQLFDEMGVPLDDKHVHLLSHGFLDAMSFAGGLSVPGMIKVGLAVIKSSASELAAEQRALSGPDDVDKLVWEVIRRYPPVVAFSYWNGVETARTALGLGMALRDPTKWEDPMQFRLRDLKDYKSAATVAWAEQSNGKTPGPNSRGCPGQSLSLVIATEFFEAFHQQQDHWSITTEGVGFSDYAPWVSKDFVMVKK